MHTYTFTKASEALSSGVLLIQHGINLIQCVRQLAENLHKHKKKNNDPLKHVQQTCTTATGPQKKKNSCDKGSRSEGCFLK